MTQYRSLELGTESFHGKTVLLRVDLNVPMHAGKVLDATRVKRVIPTIEMLVKAKAKVVLLSHFGRPKGKYDPSLSLAPLVDTLQEIFGDNAQLSGSTVRFGPSCVGAEAREAVDNMAAGDVLLLENLRFHWEEEIGDESFAKDIASLGDIYVNDAFSCSHRAHASISELPKFLPTYVGLSMLKEIETLRSIFSDPDRPLCAVVGGSKVSTKLALLENLVEKVDKLIIGGAMANSFLYAKGYSLGDSLCEYDMKEIAKSVLTKADEHSCKILLPQDMVVSEKFDSNVPCKIVTVDSIPAGYMALDIGPQTLFEWGKAIEECKTLVWNGPIGAFETSPFDASTINLARVVAGLTTRGKIKSVAGGGDTVSALSHAGVSEGFTYLSTAGGAFLEWLEGKSLPGVEALNFMNAA